MIQFPQTATPAVVPFDPVTGTDTSADVPGEAQVVDAWSGGNESSKSSDADPIARFGSTYGLHTAAGTGRGGTAVGGGGNAAPNAAPNSAPTAPVAKSPLDAPGLEGAKAWMERGLQLMKEGKYHDAVRAFEQGFLTYPDRAFILNKASALLEGGRFAEAVLTYEGYLSDPQAPRADEARKALETARARMKGVEASSTGVHESHQKFLEGFRAYEAGNYKEALAAFERAYELNPRPDLKYNIAACLDKMGAKYSAVQRYKEYLAEANGPKDRAKVERHIEKLRAEAPNVQITATGITGAREWMHRGNELLAAGKFDEAVNAFRAAYKEYPSEKILLNEAAALAGAGRYAEADIAYTRYLAEPDATRKDEARAAQDRLRTNHLGGKAATVENLAEASRQFELGADHYKAGRYVEALAAFDKAHSLNPLSVFRYNQAACLERMGQREMAAQRYEQYLTEAPNATDRVKVEAHVQKLRVQVATLERDAFDRGQEAFLQGDFRKAAHAFAEAFSHKPRPEYLFNMATAYEKAGDIGRAIDSLEWYLLINPDAKDAGSVRAKLAELKQARGD